MRTRKPSRKVVENGIAAAAVAAEAGPAAPIVIPHGRTKRAADQGSFIPGPPPKRISTWGKLNNDGSAVYPAPLMFSNFPRPYSLRQPSFEQPAFQGQVSLARPSSRHQSITPSSTSPSEPAFYTPSSTSPSEPAFSGLASPPSRLNSPAIPPRLSQIDYNELRKAQERISQIEQVAKSQQLVTELQQQLAASQQHVAERDTKLNVIQYQLAQSQKLITEWDTKLNGITQQLTGSQQHAAERRLIFERDAEIKENSRATEEDTRDSKELLECVQEQNATLTETINTLREENGNLTQKSQDLIQKVNDLKNQHSKEFAALTLANQTLTDERDRKAKALQWSLTKLSQADHGTVALKGMTKALSIERDELTARVAELEKQHQEAAKLLEETSRMIHADKDRYYQRQLKEAHTKLAAAEQDLATWEHYLSNMKKEWDEIREQEGYAAGSRSQSSMRIARADPIAVVEPQTAPRGEAVSGSEGYADSGHDLTTSLEP